MNKSEMISHVAETAGLSKVQAQEAVNAVLNGISKTLQAGEPVRLLGFGSFTAKERAARKGRNPATGKAIDIPAKTLAKFKASKELTESLN